MASENGIEFNIKFNYSEKEEVIKALKYNDYLYAILEMERELRNLQKYSGRKYVPVAMMREKFYEIINGHGIEL